MASRFLIHRTAATSALGSKGGFEIIEEAIFLIRSDLKFLIGTYYVGTLPFFLGFLYFLTDMSRNADAVNHCSVAAWGMAILFAWMKCWQSVFASGIREKMSHVSPQTPTLKQFVHLAVTQVIIQTTGLFALPIGLILTVPFAWIFAFYQNACAQRPDSWHDVKSVWRNAWQDATYFPKQNHIILMALSVFGLLVTLNIGIAIVLIPHLLNRFFGMETIFTLSGAHVLNTTFFAITISLTYLCIDPIIKAVYGIRSFYGAAITNGEDLRSELNTLLKTVNLVGIFLVVMNFPSAMASIGSDIPDVPIEKTIVSPTELDQTIEKTLKRRMFAWRTDRDLLKKNKPEGPLTSFIQWLADLMKSAVKTVGKWMDNFRDWMGKWLPKPDIRIHPPSSSSGWLDKIKLGFQILLFLILAIAIFMIIRFFKTYKEAPIPTSEKGTLPDLNEDDLNAGDLPAEDWKSLAEQMSGKGSFRLAIRAFFLGTLASLGEFSLITIAKYKSNQDYERELRRKVRDDPRTQELFSIIISMFDKIWYGKYPVGEPDVVKFAEMNRELNALVGN